MCPLPQNSAISFSFDKNFFTVEHLLRSENSKRGRWRTDLKNAMGKQFVAKFICRCFQ